MEIKERNATTTTESITKIEYADVTDDLVVYKTTITSTTTANRTKPKHFNQIIQGFAKKSAFKSWTISDRSTHRVGDDAFDMYLFKDGFLDMIRRYGNPGRFNEWSYEEYANYKIADPFDAIVAGADIKNIVHDTHDYDGMMFDIDGNPLSIAIFSDYMTNLYIDNSRYDLGKALTILKKNKNVWFPDIDEVKRIPYYNASRTSDKTIEFMWMPTQEEYTKLWEKQKNYTSHSYEKGRAMFDLDVLGLRAGGAAKYNDFHKSDSYERE